MALITCPECGRERVSDSAETCPGCGFAIKAYYEKIKQDEEEQRLEEEREKQRQIEEENRKQRDIEREIIKQEKRKKMFGSPAKKVMWTIAICLALVLVIAIGSYIHKENEIAKAIENSQYYCSEILKETSDLQKYINTIDIVYDPDNLFCKDVIAKVKDKLSDISLDMTMVDIYCREDDRVVDSLNSYVKKKMSYDTWEDYKQYIKKKYFIGEDKDESADKIVKANSYSSYSQKSEAIKNSSVIVASLSHTTSGKKYKVYGTVTNNTSRTVKFVKVKISLLDKDGKVIDTDTTYACGSEGLAPGESSKFDCYISKDSRTEKFTAEIYDYD